MRKFSILLSATVLACTVACVQEMDAPMQTGPEGQKVTISFTAEYPGMSPDTKVLLDENEKILKWEGDETATLIFGIDSTNNSNNPTIPSIAPGVFQGEITIPSGFTMENLRGIVVPSGNGANFRGNHGTYKARIRSYIDNPQTSDGTPDMDQCPFFVPLTKADIDSVDVNTFKAGSVSLYSAADLARYKVYGRHSEMESGEILQSVSITANGILAGSYEYNISNGGFGTNGSSKTVTVNSSQGQTIADKTSENGVVLYQNLLIGGSRTVSTVTVRTDKAVYTKSVNKTFSQKNKSVLRVYPIGLDLSSGFTRESLITYSADNGQTWEHKIPETFTSLAVKTGTGVNLSDETLAGIKAAMAKQSQAVDLDLRQSTYESSVFPAVFGGTADDRCTVIKSIRFPHNVTEVAENAFAYCSSLESVDLTDITTINTKAFFWSGLKTLDVPKTVTQLPGFLSFGCCTQLTEIYYDSPTVQYKDANGNRINHTVFAYVNITDGNQNPVKYIYSETDYPELYPDEPQCTITIGPNVDYLARYMFCYNDNIAKIIFQDKVGTIGNYAFDYMRNVYLFDCRLMPSPISAYKSDNYQRQLGQLAKASGKDLKILVPTGMAESFSANYPFVWMLNNGWNIVEENAEPATLEDVRIGTYNIRIQSSSDGDNNWPTRKPITVQSIKDIDFDIFGLQEAQTYHHTYLQETLGDIYGFEWFCPNTGSSKESVGIAYKKSEWSLAKLNKFYINSDPDTQAKCDTGSSGNYYRGALCGTLIHKKTGTKLFFMSTHGCLNKEPNNTYAYLYPEQEARFNPDGLPSFFVGDLNARPDWDSSVLFRTYWNDTYLTIDETLRQGCEDTFNGWDSPEGRADRRIDFVYYKGAGVTPTLYKCDNTLYDGKYPSDHWPVYADFTIEPASASTEVPTE